MARKKKTDAFKVNTLCALNVRESPSIDSKIVRVLKEGESVEVTVHDAEWYCLPDGYILRIFAIAMPEYATIATGEK